MAKREAGAAEVISAHVRIDGDEYDWFDGECEFPILPPIGATIRVIDRNANMRELRVKDIVIKGVKASTRASLPNTFAELPVVLVCTELL